MKYLLLSIFFISLFPNYSFTYQAEEYGKLPIAQDVVYRVTRYCDKGIMANGQQTFESAVACERSIPLNTKIELDGKEYVCADRYNLRLPPTVDIFTSDCKKAVGLEFKTIKILN